MFPFLGRRILHSLPTLFGVSLVAFLLIRMVPGDPVLLMLGERGGSPETVAQLREKLGLDRTLAEQYGRFIGHALQGDLGESIFSQRSVWEEFVDRFPATVELSLVALFWAVLLGIPLGVLAALKRRGWVDHLLMSASLIGYSMPIFWWGLILIMFFSVQLGWTPVSGRIGVAYDLEPWSGFLLIDTWRRGLGWAGFMSAVQHMILPAIVLGTVLQDVVADA
ncbi:MAG TPA: ABC transporter permease, partial [Bdellovibrionales bacterium]|nr:ABC transporter permease [Bdellovibrionales bacterium]